MAVIRWKNWGTVLRVPAASVVHLRGEVITGGPGTDSVIASEKYSPPAREITSVRPVGIVLWPSEFDPQDVTVPSAFSAIELYHPAAMATTPASMLYITILKP